MKQNQNDLTTTQTLNEKWDHATLANNFIFYKVMRHHPQACKQLLELFICMDDIFNHNMPIYTFENLCLENNKIKLNDRSFKHFFIAPICAKLVDNKDIRDFFNFLISNKASNKFTSELHNYVADAKHNMQWRIQYMTYERQRAYDLEEGMNRKAIEAARSFYENGVSIELIAKSLKMTEEEIKEIVKDVVPVTTK
ncbi:MAG: hypothetical protein J6J00_00425 [Treponema sp.]|nr:hypothetical protein [Treponema sp.]